MTWCLPFLTLCLIYFGGVVHSLLTVLYKHLRLFHHGSSGTHAILTLMNAFILILVSFIIRIVSIWSGMKDHHNFLPFFGGKYFQSTLLIRRPDFFTSYIPVLIYWISTMSKAHFHLFWMDEGWLFFLLPKPKNKMYLGNNGGEQALVRSIWFSSALTLLKTSCLLYRVRCSFTRRDTYIWVWLSPFLISSCAPFT